MPQIQPVGHEASPEQDLVGEAAFGPTTGRVAEDGRQQESEGEHGLQLVYRDDPC